MAALALPVALVFLSLHLLHTEAEAATRPPSKPFPGVDAFHAGEGGYACFRLPALLRLPTVDNQSLALYAEGRLKSCSDYAPIDLVYKISRDNGRTWSNVSILCTDGCTTHNGTHDAAYVNSTNQPTPVAVPGQGSKPGFIVMLCQRGGHLWTSRSLNPLGTAWEPLNDTNLKLVPGPTPGVVLQNGRMVVAAYGQALISDDSGRSWRGSESFGPGGKIPNAGEGEVAIAPNGSLLMNYRGSHPYKRVLAYSQDKGETWGAEFMPMPELGGSVEGSMITINDRNLMLTASPFGIGPDWGHRCAGPGRCNMTVWASTDSGSAWHLSYQLNESIGISSREAAAYSSMVQVNSTHVALVYERDNAAHLSLVYVPLPEISAAADV